VGGGGGGGSGVRDQLEHQIEINDQLQAPAKICRDDNIFVNSEEPGCTVKAGLHTVTKANIPAPTQWSTTSPNQAKNKILHF